MFAESLDRLVMDYSFTITTRAVSIRLVTNRPASGLLVDVGGADFDHDLITAIGLAGVTVGKGDLKVPYIPRREDVLSAIGCLGIIGAEPDCIANPFVSRDMQ